MLRGKVPRIVMEDRCTSPGNGIDNERLSLVMRLDNERWLLVL